jgi:carboxymethylenebutenolidase
VRLEIEEAEIGVTVQRAGQNRSLIGTLAQPAEAQTPMPCLLLLHEIGGVNSSLRERARALAAEGYAVFTPDLFGGRFGLRALARLVMGASVRPLHNQTVRDLCLALARMAALPGVDPTRIAVVGYSMGAAYALQLACLERSLRAAAVFCGQLPRPLSALRHSCPIVASYAGRDPTCRGIAPRLDRALTQYAIVHDLKVYASVAHAFYDPFGPMYEPQAAADAWQRTVNFLRDHLGRAE